MDLAIDELLHRMTDVVRAWRNEHGEIVARELIRAYLTGLDHGGKIFAVIGQQAQDVLYAALEGN